MPSQHRYPTIRLSSAVYEQLSQPYGEAASQCLKRYFWILDNSVPIFSENEWNLLRDAELGSVFMSESPETLMKSFLLQLDAVPRNRDTEKFIAKLQDLSFVEVIATIRTIELSSQENGIKTLSEGSS